MDILLVELNVKIRVMLKLVHFIELIVYKMPNKTKLEKYVNELRLGPRKFANSTNLVPPPIRRKTEKDGTITQYEIN